MENNPDTEIESQLRKEIKKSSTLNPGPHKYQRKPVFEDTKTTQEGDFEWCRLNR